MLKAYKYRLYPTKQQTELINKHIGSVRFVYNLALETKQTAYAGNKINLSCFALHKQLVDLKKECEWLKEINSQSLQQSITDLDSAYTRFFKGQTQFPKYKSKHSQKQSFRIPQNVIIDFENNKLVTPKFKEGINIILHRKFNGEIKQCTINKTPTCKYFVSILVDNNINNPIKVTIEENTTIGVDLGIKSFLVTSNSENIFNPKYLKENLSKLKYIQSKYSKYKGKKTKHNLTLLHESIANQRKDFLNKTSTKLIRENQTICLEDLNIKGMLQNHCLSQAISDTGWGMFVDMLKYKAEWYGKNIIQIGRFEPSSKLCSNCGTINKELTLKDRVWTCNNCNTIHDRDINAAVNIKNFALKNKLCVGRTLKNHKELPTLVGALTYEA
jgi:putative transposase